MSDRPCTCHPDDSPPVPCAKRYALTECKAAAYDAMRQRVAELEDWQRRVVQAWDHADSGGFTHAMTALIEEEGHE